MKVAVSSATMDVTAPLVLWTCARDEPREQGEYRNEPQEPGVGDGNACSKRRAHTREWVRGSARKVCEGGGREDQLDGKQGGMSRHARHHHHGAHPGAVASGVFRVATPVPKAGGGRSGVVIAFIWPRRTPL